MRQAVGEVLETLGRQLLCVEHFVKVSGTHGALVGLLSDQIELTFFNYF
jgi:hypothetical protein